MVKKFIALQCQTLNCPSVPHSTGNTTLIMTWWPLVTQNKSYGPGSLTLSVSQGDTSQHVSGSFQTLPQETDDTHTLPSPSSRLPPPATLNTDAMIWTVRMRATS